MPKPRQKRKKKKAKNKKEIKKQKLRKSTKDLKEKQQCKKTKSCKRDIISLLTLRVTLSTSILPILQRRSTEFNRPFTPIRTHQSLTLKFPFQIRDAIFIFQLLLSLAGSRTLCGDGISPTFLDDRGVLVNHWDATFRGPCDDGLRS